jgi:hypothetical protein
MSVRIRQGIRAMNEKTAEQVRAFVDQAEGNPQLAKARIHGICLLWADGQGPELGQADIEELLKTSSLYEASAAGDAAPAQGAFSAFGAA